MTIPQISAYILANVTGKNSVSNDELQTILNQILSNTFDNQGNLITTPLAFNTTTFKLDGDGKVNLSDAILAKIASIGTDGGGITTPAAPTGWTIDDTANTAILGLSAGFAATDHEYSINGGTSYNAMTSATVTVGDVAIAVGQLLGRVKAVVGTRNASATVANTVAFTVDSTGGSGTWDGAPITAFSDFGDQVTQSGNNISAVVPSGIRTTNPYKQISMAWDSSWADQFSPEISLSRGLSSGGSGNDFIFNVGVNNKISIKVNTEGQPTLYYDDNFFLPRDVNSRISVRIDQSNNVIFETSIDGGATWERRMANETFIASSDVRYGKIFFSGGIFTARDLKGVTA